MVPAGVEKRAEGRRKHIGEGERGEARETRKKKAGCLDIES